MLSKKICKRCINAFQSYDRPSWSLDDEYYWREKRLRCRRGLKKYVRWDGRGSDVLIDAGPPEWCPFALEHLMETQKC